MAGHSKWANIKRRKGAQDAKRGKLFTKLLREVTVAAKEGGGDPDGNPRLRAAMSECKSSNVPNDKIDNAIKKGTGEIEGAAYEEVAYEGYGPGGVAMIVETMTDNRNRTVGEVRHVFSKFGGNLGQDGCVAYLFERRGYFVLAGDGLDEESFMELAVEAGAEDFSTDDGFEIFTGAASFGEARDLLAEKGVAVESAQLAMIPASYVALDGDKGPQFLRLLEEIENLDDVQNVWSNAELDDSLLEAQSD
ncbi:MAG: YebC/PmpR family DNA-binding transcriptional regulator [Holophagales bacterium]|nr:YebC/PmpR family DNA-binding transcriptional regulator [Holophagales bacterium]